MLARPQNHTRNLLSYVDSAYSSSAGSVFSTGGSPSPSAPLAPIVLIGNGPVTLIRLAPSRSRSRLPSPPLADHRLRLHQSVLKPHVINGSSPGALVDQYQDVGRFNLHKTKGFEKLVGSKTTICFMGQMKRPQKKKPFCPTYIVPVVAVAKTKNHKKIDRGTIKNSVKRFYGRKGLGNKLEIMTDHVQKVLKNKYGLKKGPSTGIQAILYCAQKYKKVAIAGFDFLHGDHMHYFEKKRKKSTTHDMKGEAKIILQLEAEGKLFRLY